MFSSSFRFLKNKKLQNISTFTLVSLALIGCQSQSAKKALSNNDILGSFDSKNLKIAELTPAERNELFNAQKKLYETAQTIIQKHYLDDWFTKYQSQNKFATLEEAKNDFFAKNTKINTEEVKNFIAQNSANPQMQQIPETEREGLVKRYLSQVEQAKAEQSILQKAEDEGKIKVIAIDKPNRPVVKFADIGYKYDSTLKDPKITIVEFADYQCPYCVQASGTIQQVLDTYKGKVQYVFRDFPLTQIHPQAMPAAIVAKCADKQGQYWPMHKLLFSRSPMAPLTADLYTKYAEQLKLNMPEFNSCMADDKKEITKSIMADLDDANLLGINATPSIYINGEKYESNLSFDSLKKEIDTRLASK
ncbi:DsbA family protein [Fluviispira multicolorata]|uniref:Thioredoxin domain-containing protein n=1 Tax=Fluviispira multicolorata TaxID=2654512 RepID=A0A833JC21_9BACT|nr:thioredoxin domain-containing protein [Fluviispira multicolorata]KAB8029931.1 thioredoxin domain-containing protein [Fluviispira multicolorata]